MRLNTKFFKFNPTIVYIFQDCFEYNLEVGLNSKTKRNAAHEAEEMFRDKVKFEDYGWKIEGCSEGGINNFSKALKEEIIKRFENERTEDFIKEFNVP